MKKKVIARMQNIEGNHMYTKNSEIFRATFVSYYGVLLMEASKLS